MTSIFSGRLAIPGAGAAVLMAMAFALMLQTTPQAGASGNNNDHVASSGVVFGSGYSVRRPQDYDKHQNQGSMKQASVSDTSLSGAKLTHARKHNGRNYHLLERKRRIETHNREIAARNPAKREYRSGIITAPSYQDNRRIVLGGETPGVGIVHQPPCPRGHYCGCRLYTDGTGPRIIVIGSDAPDPDKAYNGMDGPKVITLD